MLASRLVSVRAPLVCTEVPDPVAAPDGVVIRVRTAGICGTDAHLWAGDWDWAGISLALPRILGHEVSGDVVEVGTSVSEYALGDRVVVPFHLACGACGQCRRGLSNLCDRAGYLGSTHDGAFAEYMAVPKADFNLVRLPESVSFDDAAALGCRFMTAFRAVVDLGRAEAGEWMIVFGAAGGVGRAALQLARAVGVRTIAVDVPEQCESLEAVGAADHVVSTTDPDLPQHVADLTGGGANLAIDAVARAETTALAVASLGKSGRLLQIGLTGPDSRGIVSIPIDEIVHRELRVMGVNGNPHTRFDPILALVAEGRCRPSDIISGSVTLDEVGLTVASLRHHKVQGMVVAHPHGGTSHRTA